MRQIYDIRHGTRGFLGLGWSHLYYFLSAYYFGMVFLGGKLGSRHRACVFADRQHMVFMWYIPGTRNGSQEKEYRLTCIGC
jgi:hypothetical protein